MAQADGNRDLRPFIIIALAIVVAGGLIAAALVFTILDAKKEIIDETRAAVRAADPFQINERIDENVSASIQETTESTLRQAALAQESHRLNSLSYATTVEELQVEGFVPHSDVLISIAASNDDWFCLKADHFMADDDFYYDSEIGEVRAGPEGLTGNCAAFQP